MVDLNPRACLFGHRASVNTLAASRSFRTLLSASVDGQVLLWDLNRLDLIRVMTQGKSVEVNIIIKFHYRSSFANDRQCARINDVSGIIMLCRGPEVALFTLNGELLLEQHVCVEGDETITACAFYEGAGNEYLQQNLVFTGHRRGVVNVCEPYHPWSSELVLSSSGNANLVQIWNMDIHDGEFILDHVKRLNHLDVAGFNVPAAITSILAMPLALYTGDDDGRVVSYSNLEVK